MAEQVNVTVHKQELLASTVWKQERIPVLIMDLQMFCADEQKLKRREMSDTIQHTLTDSARGCFKALQRLYQEEIPNANRTGRVKYDVV